MEKRICKKCNFEQPLENFEFYYLKSNPTLRRHSCKKCRLEQHKNYDSRSGFGLRTKLLKQKYNMTPQDYLDISNAQDNKCYICKKVNTFGPHSNKLVVDHCHKTGKLRKLLCDKCNKGLGQFNDDPELLEKAMKYILMFKE